MKLMKEQPGIWVDGVQIKGNQSPFFKGGNRL